MWKSAGRARLFEFYCGICLTTEGKARKNLSQGKKTSVRLSKTSVRAQYTYYQNTHTLQNTYTHKHTHTHTNTHTHTLQNNIKPPQYKLKQNAHKKEGGGGTTVTYFEQYLY
jgi:hypothetical protein